MGPPKAKPIGLGPPGFSYPVPLASKLDPACGQAKSLAPKECGQAVCLVEQPCCLSPDYLGRGVNVFPTPRRRGLTPIVGPPYGEGGLSPTRIQENKM